MCAVQRSSPSLHEGDFAGRQQHPGIDATLECELPALASILKRKPLNLVLARSFSPSSRGLLTADSSNSTSGGNVCGPLVIAGTAALVVAGFGVRTVIHSVRQDAPVQIAAAPIPRSSAQRGPRKAIVAVAASMLTAAFHIIRGRVVYRDLGADHFTKRELPRLRSGCSSGLKDSAMQSRRVP